MVHCEADLDAQVAEDVAPFTGEQKLDNASLWSSVAGGSLSEEADEVPEPLPSLVSSRSIRRDTAAIPALTSLLTSELRVDIVSLRASHRSFHPRVFFVIESLYLAMPVDDANKLANNVGIQMFL
jgi:hypothetical protein